MRCSKCATENREGRKFCAECGAPLNARCPSCGAENEPAEKFCGECGVALAGNVQAVSAKASATKSTAPEIHIIPVQPDASEVPEGERKTVTALFADIKGSTELERDLDPEEARVIIDPALRIMIDAVGRYGGCIVQSTGDGILHCLARPSHMRIIRSVRYTQHCGCRKRSVTTPTACEPKGARRCRYESVLTLAKW